MVLITNSSYFPLNNSSDYWNKSKLGDSNTISQKLIYNNKSSLTLP